MYVVHHLLRLLRLAAGALLCAGLGLVSLSAFAFDPYPDFHFAPGGGGMTGTTFGGSAASWTAGTKTPTSTGMMFSSSARTIPFEPPTTGSFKVLFTPKNLGKAMTAGAAVALPLLLKPALSALLNQACVRAFGGAMTLSPGGEWEECHFTQQTTNLYWTYGSPATASGSRSASCSSALSQQLGRPGGDAYAVMDGLRQGGEPSDPKAQATCVIYRQGAYWTSMAIDWKGTTTQPVQDGWQPIVPDDAESKIENTLNQWAATDFSRGDYSAAQSLQKVLDELYAAGQPVEGTVQAPVVQSPVITTGPATTTTNADGTTSTSSTTNTNDYSCMVINDGKAVQCSQTTTTTTTTQAVDPAHPASSPASSTTTTTTATDPSKTNDECKLHPDIIGCSTYGTPQAADTLSKDTKAITFTPVAFQGGSCPAPINFTAFGKSYQLSYETLCSKLHAVSVLLLVLSGGLAAYIFADGFRV